VSQRHRHEYAADLPRGLPDQPARSRREDPRHLTQDRRAPRPAHIRDRDHLQRRAPAPPQRGYERQHDDRGRRTASSRLGCYDRGRVTPPHSLVAGVVENLLRHSPTVGHRETPNGGSCRSVTGKRTGDSVRVARSDRAVPTSATETRSQGSAAGILTSSDVDASARIAGHGTAGAEGGADHPEGEAEHRKDDEAEDQGVGQVDADGGHQFTVERPSVDGVTA
jgi:hypothetical protein